MAILKLAICQIDIRLKNYPYQLAQPINHRKKVVKCIEEALQRNAEFIIFPEYNLNSPIIEELKTLSTNITILGGSYASNIDTNRTVIAFNNSSDSYDKLNLSPYEEKNVGSTMVPGTGNFIRPDINNVSAGVLTCFDYYAMARRTLEQNPEIDILFSPAVNNNHWSFLVESESIHQRMPSKYTVYCNAAKFWLDGIEYPEVNGGSYVFGPHDPDDKQNLVIRNWALDEFKQNIFFLGEGEKIGFIDVEIPYIRESKGSMTYTHNPTNVDILNL